MLFAFFEKLINEVCSSCLKEMKDSFTLSNSIVSIHSKSLSCILSELISFGRKSLQYLHAFGANLTTFLLVPLKYFHFVKNFHRLVHRLLDEKTIFCF